MVWKFGRNEGERMGEYGRNLAGKCQKCDAWVPWGAEKCPGCGAALHDDDQAAQKKGDADEDNPKEKVRRSTLFIAVMFIGIILCLLFVYSQNTKY
jgi:uncharacterized membrane protein YvbJ